MKNNSKSDREKTRFHFRCKLIAAKSGVCPGSERHYDFGNGGVNISILLQDKEETIPTAGAILTQTRY